MIGKILLRKADEKGRI